MVWCFLTEQNLRYFFPDNTWRDSDEPNVLLCVPPRHERKNVRIFSTEGPPIYSVSWARLSTSRREDWAVRISHSTTNPIRSAPKRLTFSYIIVAEQSLRAVNCSLILLVEGNKVVDSPKIMGECKLSFQLDQNTGC